MLGAARRMRGLLTGLPLRWSVLRPDGSVRRLSGPVLRRLPVLPSRLVLGRLPVLLSGLVLGRLAAPRLGLW